MSSHISGEELLRRIERLEHTATIRNIRIWQTILRLEELIAKHLGVPAEDIDEIKAALEDLPGDLR